MDDSKTTSFNLDDEYEGGFFGADGEYYCIREKKKTKKMTKNDQIYGIFNSGSDDNNDNNNDDNDDFMDFGRQNFLNSKFKKGEKKLLNDELTEKVKVIDHKVNKQEVNKTHIKERLHKEIVNKDNDNLYENASQMFLKKKKKTDEIDVEDYTNYEYQTKKNLLDFGKQVQNKKAKIHISKQNNNNIKEQELKKDIQIEEKKLKKKYGKGLDMMKKMGFKTGEGIGEQHQGMLEPLEIKKLKKQSGIGAGEENKQMFEKLDMQDDFLGDRKEKEKKRAEEIAEIDEFK